MFLRAATLTALTIGLVGAPGVAQACIELQDQARVDVNVLFFLLWNATQGRALNAADVTKIEEAIGPWREMTVVPIRNVRRALKTPPSVMAPDAAEGLRTRIKAVELEAERLQQEAMFALAPLGAEVSDPADAARANVAAYEQMLSVRFPREAAATLLTAFSALPRE